MNIIVNLLICMLLYIVVDALYTVRTSGQTSPLADGTLLLKLKFIYLSI